MRKSIAVLCGAVLGIAGQAIAQTTTPSTTPMATTPSATTSSSTSTTQKDSRWKGMDTNNDGMVSEAEFNNYHKGMWGKMKRNPAGMAMMSDIDAMYAPGTVPSAIPGEPRQQAKP